MKKVVVMLVAFLLVGIVTENILAKETVVDVIVTENGFEPKEIKVKPNVPVTLNITRKTDSTCSRDIVIPEKNIRQGLPLNKSVKVSLGSLKEGQVKFGCAMDMMDSGIIFVK